MSYNNNGFAPLDRSRSNSNEMNDTGIPLHQVTSRASSSGVRRPDQSTIVNTASMDEKRGLFNRHAGRRRKKRGEDEMLRRKGTGGSDIVALNAMGKLYTRIIGASIITRYLVYVVPVALLLAAPLIILPVTGHREDIFVGGPLGPPLFNLFLWIEISWLSLWVGKLVASTLPSIFMFFCGVVSSGTRKYATVLRSLEIALSLFFWALASWQTFINLFRAANNSNVGWVVNLGRVLGASFVCSAVYLGEKAIVQLIGITYHQTSFANRIHASKREIHLLGMLYDASRQLFPMYCPEFAEEDYVINDSIDILLAGGKRGHKRGGSNTPMKLLGDVGRFGDKVTSVFGNIASEITGKKVFNPNSAHSIVVEALEKVASSEALARRIWMSFVVEGKDALYPDDVQEVLGPANKDEAEEAFNAIDNDQNGDISLDEMVRKVVEIGTERKAIAEGMKDISQALRVFDSVLLFVVFLICIFIFLAFFQSSFITTLTTAGTALLSLSFIFAVTAQEFLGSCIFLFVKHPYDVGDRVDITGTQLVVDKISLLYTVFTRIDKMQVVQVPNIQLNNLWVENVSRSKAMKEVVEVNVSYDTSFEDVELLRQEMERFVRAPENSRDFQPDLTIGIGGVGDLDKLNLKVAIKHKSNWHNDAVRASRRSKFMCALALALKKVPIYNPGGGGEALGGPTNPSYAVAVSDAFAAAQRAEAAKAKEAKRLAPAAKPADAQKAEKEAISDINARDPVVAVKDDWTERREAMGGAAVAAGASNNNNGLTTTTSTATAATTATLGTSTSRDASAERQRSHDIESVREQLLSKRESQKGRRAPGQGLPPLAFGGEGPGLQLTQASPRMARFDEEAETGGFGGGASAYPAGVYYGGAPAPPPMMQQQQQQQSQAGYSIFPPPQSRTPPGSSGSGSGIPSAQGPFHPLQSQPIASQRGRGQSVSRTQQGQQQQQQQQGGFR